MNTRQPTIAELSEQLKRLQSEIQDRRETAKKDLRADIEKMLQDAELTLSDVFPDISKGSKGAPASKRSTSSASCRVGPISAPSYGRFCRNFT